MWTASFLCSRCNAPLEDPDVEYEARGSSGNRHTKSLPGHWCPTCSTVYVSRTFVDELDEFVESVPHDLQIIPEVGIRTADALEDEERDCALLDRAGLPITTFF